MVTFHSLFIYMKCYHLFLISAEKSLKKHSKWTKEVEHGQKSVCTNFWVQIAPQNLLKIHNTLNNAQNRIVYILHMQIQLVSENWTYSAIKWWTFVPLLNGLDIKRDQKTKYLYIFFVGFSWPLFLRYMSRWPTNKLPCFCSFAKVYL